MLNKIIYLFSDIILKLNKMTAIEFNYRITGLQDHLKNFANKLTSNEYDSDDLVQETLLKALRFRDKFVDSTNLKAWLFTIMKNTYINDYRKKKRANTILENTVPYAYLNVRSSYHEGCAESKIAEKLIVAKIESLPKEYKLPFKMHNEGFKYKEISEKLQIPIGTVKSRIYAARKVLSSRLLDYVKN